MKLTIRIIISLFISVTLPAICFAATSGPSMPWDNPLTIARDSVTGTVAHVFVTLFIVGAGLSFAMTEAGHGARKIAGVVLGSALALGAVDFMTALGFSGAVF